MNAQIENNDQAVDDFIAALDADTEPKPAHIVWNNGRYRLVVVYRPKPLYLFEEYRRDINRWEIGRYATHFANNIESVRQFLEHIDAEARS